MDVQIRLQTLFANFLLKLTPILHGISLDTSVAIPLDLTRSLETVGGKIERGKPVLSGDFEALYGKVYFYRNAVLTTTHEAFKVDLIFLGSG
jgi:hypothetical protein